MGSPPAFAWTMAGPTHPFFFCCYSQFVFLFPHPYPHPTHMYPHATFFQSWSFEEGFYFSWKMVSLYIHPPLGCVVLLFLEPRSYFLLSQERAMKTSRSDPIFSCSQKLGHPLLQQGFVGTLVLSFGTLLLQA